MQAKDESSIAHMSTSHLSLSLNFLIPIRFRQSSRHPRHDMAEQATGAATSSQVSVSACPPRGAVTDTRALPTRPEARPHHQVCGHGLGDAASRDQHRAGGYGTAHR